MSAEERTVSDKPTSAPTRKRSPIERIVVWGLIVFLAVAVALEYRGMQGYKQTLNALEDKADAARLEPDKPFKLSEAKSLATMGAAFSEPAEKNGSIECSASWFTFLSFLPDRHYAIYLGLSDAGEDPDVTGITTAGHRAVEEKARSGG